MLYMIISNLFSWRNKDQKIEIIVKTGSVFFNCVWHCTLEKDNSERDRDTAERGEDIIESGLH